MFLCGVGARDGGVERARYRLRRSATFYDDGMNRWRSGGPDAPAGS